jgi:hypothetical protein
VAQRAHFAAGNGDEAHIEEFDIRERAAVDLLDDRLGIRPLDLEAVELAHHRFSHRPGRRTVILHDLYVVAAGLGVKHDPVRRRSAAHEDEFIRFQVEKDPVADHLTVVVAWHELLGPVDVKSLEAIDGQVRQQLARVGTFDE